MKKKESAKKGSRKIGSPIWFDDFEIEQLLAGKAIIKRVDKEMVKFVVKE